MQGSHVRPCHRRDQASSGFCSTFNLQTTLIPNRNRTTPQHATLTATMTRTDSLLHESNKDTQDSLALYEALRDELGVRIVPYRIYGVNLNAYGIVQLSGETRQNGSHKLASASIERPSSSAEKKADDHSIEDAEAVETRLEKVGPPSELEPQTGFTTGIS